MPTHDLILTLSDYRRRLRALLVTDGVARLVAGTVGVGLAVGVLDWWVRFPGVVRLIGLVGYLGWAVGWAQRRIWRPAKRRIELTEIALAVQQAAGGAPDQIATAIAMIEQGAAQPPLLRDRVVEPAVESLRATPFERVFSTRRARRSLLAATGAVLGMTLIGAVLPRVTWIGAQRVILPLSDAAWPRWTQIVPLTGDGAVAEGDAFSVAMRLGRGRQDRAFVEWQTGDGPVRRETMNVEADGRFTWTIDNIRQPVRYAFFCGDDSTGERRYRIEALPRPEIRNATIETTPPPYCDNRASNRQPLGTRATVDEGGTVTWTIQGAQPLGVGTALELEDGTRWPMAATEDPNTMRLQRAIATGVVYRIRLRSAAGVETQDATTYRVDVRPDAPPTCSIARPIGTVEATLDGVLVLDARFADDHGLASARIEATVNTLPTRVVSEFVGATGPKHDESTARVEPVRPQSLAETVDLEMAGLGAAEGDCVHLRLAAVDAYDLGGQKHATVYSTPLRVQIVPNGQFERNIQRDLIALRERLRRILADAQATGAATGRLAELDEKTTVTLTHGEADRLAGRVRQSTGATAALAADFDQLTRRLMAGGPSLSSRVDARPWAFATREAAESDLASAEKALQSAASESSIETLRTRVADSATLQKKAAQALEDVLARLDAQARPDDVATGLRELLDQQESLLRDASTLATRTLGQDAAALPADERDRLAALADRQAALAARSGRLAGELSEQAARLDDSRPGDAAAIRRAAASAERGAVAARMNEAAEQARGNRLAAAQESQRAAAAALRGALAAFEERPQRELEELSRKAREAAERVARLIQAQREINTRLSSADDGEGLSLALARRQSTLARTTKETAAAISTGSGEGGAARPALGRAAERMGAAGEAIESNDRPTARTEAGAALAALEEALAAINTAQDRLDEEQGRRSLAAIRQALTEIIAKQQALNQDTQTLSDKTHGGRAKGRADVVRAGQLAARQREAATALDPVRELLASAVVYRRLCEQARADLDSAAEALANKEPGRATPPQSAALRRLNWLLACSDEERPSDATSYASSESGGGGAKPAAAKPVPTLAELKVLKLMQTAVNEQTRAEAAGDDPAVSTDPAARAARIATAAKAQAEVRDLAAEMLRAAQVREGRP